MTRLELLKEAANNVGRQLTTLAPDGVTAFKDRLITALNESVQPWAARAVTDESTDGYHFTEFNKTADMSTVVGDKSYSLPQTLRDLYDLTLIDGNNSWKLHAVSRRVIDRYYPDPTTYPARFRPRWYTRYGRAFEAIPIPDAIYTIRARYSTWPTDLSSDSQVTDFLNKDDVLIARLTGEAFGMLQEYDADAKEWYAKSQQLLLEAVLADPQDWDWEPTPIPFTASPTVHGEYWTDPFIMENP